MARPPTSPAPDAGPDGSSNGTGDAVAGGSTVTAVVVNHDAGHDLLECVASLRAEGVADVTVVDNASSDGSPAALEAADAGVRVLRTGANLGYGAGANRGITAATGDFVLVANPDVAVHRGAVAALARTLGEDATLAVAGPRILEADGSRYPSARRFPTLGVAVGHALLAGVAPGNRFSRRYRMADLDPDGPTEVDWVSGACFVARRRALVELGGFDESYFMYAEDTDLCWRARQAGWGVAYVPDAVVTHLQGVSTARRPYRMLVAHHRSVYRFAARTTRGWRRSALPAMAALLVVRLVVACARQALVAGHPRRARRRAE